MLKITVLTCTKYVHPDLSKPYEANIQLEYDLLKAALEEKGVVVERTNWDNKNYDFTKTDAVVFRTIWDYFERYTEFSTWVKQISKVTTVINPLSLVEWNIDKHYLIDLQKKSLPIVETVFVDKGNFKSLNSICTTKGWGNIVIKPAVSGAAFLTYKIKESEILTNENLFKKLVAERDMLVQQFQETIISKGEASLMVFNGKYTHAILKCVKEGDFRVQDDFGGTVHPYTPTQTEILLAEQTFAICNPTPAYGRLDIVWDKQGNPLISELEIFEPELWLRNKPEAATDFTEGILSFLKK